ncbi:MAG: glycosyltransferase family 2 protein [Bacteroidota bacterium]
MPEISVILPFYNAQDTLGSSVNSILKQSFTDFELLLINNNSSDKSVEIAKKLAQKDNRIHLMHEHKQGIVPALQKGFHRSQGKYIARMDADDISVPDRFELQHDLLETRQDVGLVASCVKLFPAKTSNLGLMHYVNWQNQIITHKDILVKSFVESPLIHPSVMFRKQTAENFGYYHDGDFPEDYELFLRWLEAGVKFSKIDKVLLHWRDEKNRLTRTDKRYRREAFFQTKLKYLIKYMKLNNPDYPEVYGWGAGKIARKWRRLLEGEGIQFKAVFEVDPAKIDNKEVLHYSEIPERGTIFIVSLVSNKGAGEKIKEYLTFIDYVEGKDFILTG